MEAIMVYEVEALVSAGWVRCGKLWKHRDVTWYSEGEVETPLDADGLPLLTTVQVMKIEAKYAD
jgi:hypothetical protein